MTYDLSGKQSESSTLLFCIVFPCTGLFRPHSFKARNASHHINISRLFVIPRCRGRSGGGDHLLKPITILIIKEITANLFLKFVSWLLFICVHCTVLIKANYLSVETIKVNIICMWNKVRCLFVFPEAPGMSSVNEQGRGAHYTNHYSVQAYRLLTVFNRFWVLLSENVFTLQSIQSTANSFVYVSIVYRCVFVK